MRSISKYEVDYETEEYTNDVAVDADIRKYLDGEYANVRKLYSIALRMLLRRDEKKGFKNNMNKI